VPRTNSLTKFEQATVGGDGTAVVTISVPGHGIDWRITSISVTSTATDDCEARVYKNGGGALIAGSYSGSMDSAGGVIDLSSQENIRCVWTNATPGATVQLSIFGTETIRGG
jgi:hypothetical protein